MDMSKVYNECAQNPQTTKPKRPALHPECKKYLDSFPDMVRRIKANSARFEFLDQLKEEFKDCYSHSMAYAPCAYWEVSFQFATFAQAKRVLRRMAEAGIKRVGKVRQNPEFGTMIWDFVDWRVTGYFSSGTCKYVKTGTKLVEVPIMELKCDEVLDPQFKATVTEADADGLPF